jgi:tetratricopeptide (TPR) repeat protein
VAKSDPLLRAKKKKAQQLAQQGRVAEARELFGEICRRDRRDVDAWLNFGALSGRLGFYADAETAFKQALALRPGEPAISFNLAGLAELQQDPAAAEQHYLNYLKLKPDAVDGLKRLALLYLTLGRLDEAEDYCQRVLRHNPADAAMHNCLANVKQEQGDFDAAEAAYHASLEHGAQAAEVYANLGNLFHGRGDFEQSLDWYKKSLELAPRSAATLGSLGFLYFRYAHFDKARICFDQALEIEPDNHAVRWNRALLLLLHGEFKQGWQDYESRFHTLETVRHIGRRHAKKPRWDGSEIQDKTLLVYAEQGLGDTLQFCRYLPLIKARVGRLLFECQPPLQSLLQSLAGVDQLLPVGEAVEYDYQIPLLSLPGLLATDLDTIPNKVPYLAVENKQIVQWQQIIDTTDLKVGLVWAGNPEALSDKRRSISLQMLAPLAQVSGVTFYSLQKGPAAEQLQAVPAGMKIVDLAPQLNDFADTAAAIANLDLVITVDTAVAHLAGALGRPVWTLIYFPSDWRWLLEREDSPWYPTMRLFRQTEIEQWSPVIERLMAALHNEV